MQSPRRLDAVATTNPNEDLYSLSRLKMTLAERQRDEVRLQEVHQLEKREIDGTASKLEMAIHNASGALNQKKKMLDDANRDIAAMAVLRSKQMHDRSQRQAQLEESIRQLRLELEGLVAAVSDTEQELLDKRQDLAEKQRTVESRYGAAATLQNKISDHIRQVDMLKAHHQSTTTKHGQEQAQLETHLVDLEREASKITEHNRRITSANAAAAEDHHDQVDVLKKQLRDLEEAQQHHQQLLHAARDRMQEMARNEDEASQHYRKADEEAARDSVQDRQLFLQKLNNERADMVRAIRNETEKQCNGIRGRIDQTVGQLPVLRDDIQRGFQREIELHQQVRNLSEELVGQESAAQRHQIALEHDSHWKDRLSHANDDLAVKHKVLEERHNFLQVLKDTTAPLPQVENSISELQAKANSYSTARADAEAEHSIWKIQNQEKLEVKRVKMHAIREEITDLHQKLRETHDDQEERRQDMEAELLTMRSEKNAVETKLDEIQERNKLLNQTLEHLTRQRRILADELAQRRDAARMAATTLLAQLE